MRPADVRPLARSLALTIAAIAVLAATPTIMLGQGQTGTVAGHVADSAGAPLAADISVIGNARFGVYAGADGSYAIPQLPAGDYRLQAHFIGFKPDTFSVTVTAGQTAYHRIVLREDVNTLKSVVVSSPRLNETTAGALQEQKDADNIVTVMSGDEIRALPNANAAEALARLPGVTAERDEGEGKYVEIRGTPPDFQHVTIDGADVPGTLATDVRAVKLDDVPADLLGAIEVTKTLTADQDARAIGGSVNLVTKVPEGAPHGYFAGNYAYQSLQSTDNGQADVSYGGRVGDTQKFGFLMSGTYNRTNRTIDDVEPSYGADFWAERQRHAHPEGSAYNHITRATGASAITTTIARATGSAEISTTASLRHRPSSSRDCGARSSTKPTGGRPRSAGAPTQCSTACRRSRRVRLATRCQPRPDRAHVGIHGRRETGPGQRALVILRELRRIPGNAARPLSGRLQRDWPVELLQLHLQHQPTRSDVHGVTGRSRRDRQSRELRSRHARDRQRVE